VPRHRILRAARAFLDPTVNLGPISPQRAKSFLMDEVVPSEGMAAQGTPRYTLRVPGQATSYFYGYQRLMQTRGQRTRAAQQIRPEAFNDFVLSPGLVPPQLLQKAVIKEWVPGRQKQ